MSEHKYDCYEEFICRAAMEWYFPNTYFIKRESPDFYSDDKKIGMEVTIAQVGKVYTNSQLYSKYMQGAYGASEKIKKKLQRDGKFLSFGYAHNPTDGNPVSSIADGLEKKLSKLQNWYSEFEECWLVFFIEMPIMNCYIEQIFNCVVEKSKNHNYVFNKIFIVSIKFLMQINIKGKPQYCVREIPCKLLDDFYNKADDDCNKNCNL